MGLSMLAALTHSKILFSSNWDRNSGFQSSMCISSKLRRKLFLYQFFIRSTPKFTFLILLLLWRLFLPLFYLQGGSLDSLL